MSRIVKRKSKRPSRPPAKLKPAFASFSVRVAWSWPPDEVGVRLVALAAARADRAEQHEQHELEREPSEQDDLGRRPALRSPTSGREERG